MRPIVINVTGGTVKSRVSSYESKIFEVPTEDSDTKVISKKPIDREVGLNGIRDLINAFENIKQDEGVLHKSSRSKSYGNLLKLQEKTETDNKYKSSVKINNIQNFGRKSDEEKLNEINEIKKETVFLHTRIENYNEAERKNYVFYQNQIVDLLTKIGQIESDGNDVVKIEKMKCIKMVQNCNAILTTKINSLSLEGVTTGFVPKSGIQQAREIFEKQSSSDEKKVFAVAVKQVKVFQQPRALETQKSLEQPTVFKTQQSVQKSNGVLETQTSLELPKKVFEKQESKESDDSEDVPDIAPGQKVNALKSLFESGEAYVPFKDYVKEQKKVLNYFNGNSTSNTTNENQPAQNLENHGDSDNEENEISDFTNSENEAQDNSESEDPEEAMVDNSNQQQLN